jgi:hypothetical protein
MQVGVQLDALTLPGHRLHRAGRGVATEQHVVGPRQLDGLHDPRVGAGAVVEQHLGAGGDVAAGLDDAVVAQGDPDAGVGADQAALAHGDDLLAASGQGAHDRGAAPDVGPVAHHDARADPALHHRGAERAGVEVDEALVHDGRAFGQVRTEAHPVGVGDADTGGQDVVGHPRELVDAEDADVAVCRREAQPGELEALHGAGAGAGPHDVGEQAEDAVEVDAVRGDQPVAEQVQPQPDVVGVGRGGLQVLDDGEDDGPAYPAVLVDALEAGQLDRGLDVTGRGAQRGQRVPGVEDPALALGAGEGRESEGPGRGGSARRGGSISRGGGVGHLCNATDPAVAAGHDPRPVRGTS